MKLLLLMSLWLSAMAQNPKSHVENYEILRHYAANGATAGSIRGFKITFENEYEMGGDFYASGWNVKVEAKSGHVGWRRLSVYGPDPDVMEIQYCTGKGECARPAEPVREAPTPLGDPRVQIDEDGNQWVHQKVRTYGVWRRITTDQEIGGCVVAGQGIAWFKSAKFAECYVDSETTKLFKPGKPVMPKENY